MLLFGQPGGVHANQTDLCGARRGRVHVGGGGVAQGLVSAAAAPAAPQFLSQPPFLFTAVRAEPSHWNKAGPVRPDDLAAHRPMDHGNGLNAIWGEMEGIPKMLGTWEKRHSDLGKWGIRNFHSGESWRMVLRSPKRQDTAPQAPPVETSPMRGRPGRTDTARFQPASVSLNSIVRPASGPCSVRVSSRFSLGSQDIGAGVRGHAAGVARD
eukprot:gene9223-biopygen18193